jgi:hypothetical protein
MERGDRGRYSIVFRRMWNDEKFRRLSAPQPCGQVLWMRFLCGPELGPIPGLFAAREPGIADAMGWELEPFRKSFLELRSNGLAVADWRAGLVWVPNAIFYNEPANPNVVKGWADAWAELPECQLKSQAHAHLCAYLKKRGEQFEDTFRNRCPNGLANQEQEQDQEREQEGGTPGAVTSDPPAASPSAKIRPRTADDLIHCLRVAVQREQPQNGFWNPGGPFAAKDAREFLEGFGDDLEEALTEIEQRISIFAKDPAARPWTVRRFAQSYNAIVAGGAAGRDPTRGHYRATDDQPTVTGKVALR